MRPDALQKAGKTCSMLSLLGYVKEGGEILPIGIGCTGGQDRSVASYLRGAFLGRGPISGPLTFSVESFNIEAWASGTAG